MTAAERKNAIVSKMKSDATSKLSALETLKIKTLEDIDSICSGFLQVCLDDNDKLQSLTDFEAVRELSQELDNKLTRMNNFLSELPLHCQEFYERDIFDSDLSKVNSAMPQGIDSLPSLADLDMQESLDFLNLLASSESPPSSGASFGTAVKSLPTEVQSKSAQGHPIVCSRRKKKHILHSPTEAEESAGSSGVFSGLTSASEHHYHRTTCVKPPPVYRVSCPNECQVAVTHVDGPDRFYVQIQDLRNQLTELEVNVTNEMMIKDKALSRLERSMIGGPAIVYYHEYQNFFRAWTRRQLASDSTVEVYFLDWGNTSFVALDCCYVMPQKFSNLPAAAIQCCLQDKTQASDSSKQVRHVEHQWPVSAKNIFKKMVLNRKVRMNFIGHFEVAEERPKDMYQSLSYDVNIAMGSSVGDIFEKLVRKNYGPLNL